MEQFLQNIDIYNVGATILSVILASVIPFMSYKYHKLKKILQACKQLVNLMVEAGEDSKISPKELHAIVDQLKVVVNTIKD